VLLRQLRRHHALPSGSGVPTALCAAALMPQMQSASPQPPVRVGSCAAQWILLVYEDMRATLPEAMTTDNPKVSGLRPWLEAEPPQISSARTWVWGSRAASSLTTSGTPRSL